MSSYSPEQYAKKLKTLATTVIRDDPKAIKARAAVTQATILATASGVSKRARRYGKGWVRQRPTTGDAIELRLRGGFAYLTQRGSWKKPGGWDIKPKRAEAIRTPFGPRMHVHHPYARPTPFWEPGLALSRKPGQRAYEKVIRASIFKVLR